MVLDVVGVFVCNGADGALICSVDVGSEKGVEYERLVIESLA